MLNKYCVKSIWNEYSDSNCAIKIMQDENRRNENYQNNLKQQVARPEQSIQQSINAIKPNSKADDIDDNDSDNSISESLNNYLDMKVILEILKD